MVGFCGSWAWGEALLFSWYSEGTIRFKPESRWGAQARLGGKARQRGGFSWSPPSTSPHWKFWTLHGSREARELFFWITQLPFSEGCPQRERTGSQVVPKKATSDGWSWFPGEGGSSEPLATNSPGSWEWGFWWGTNSICHNNYSSKKCSEISSWAHILILVIIWCL